MHWQPYRADPADMVEGETVHADMLWRYLLQKKLLLTLLEPVFSDSDAATFWAFTTIALRIERYVLHAVLHLKNGVRCMHVLKNIAPTRKSHVLFL